MALRNVDNALKNALVDNVPLQVYHLVKFEKPSNINYEKNNQTVPDTNFVYLTDAPYSVDFDNQTYNPTQFGKVGDVIENTEAKATGMSLSLSANSLGRNAIVTLTCSQLAAGGSTTATVDLDLFQSGFQVGDEVKFEGSGVDFTARLNRIRSGTSIDITAITATSAVSGAQVTATYNSGAITALTSSSLTALNFQSYINKTVDVYRCFANPKTGVLYGAPVLLFKGIISKGSLKDSAAGKSEMRWTLTSHWGDFVRVQGRLTADEFHRALDGSGVTVEDSLIKPQYGSDFGFEHADKSLNVLAPYIQTKTRPKLRKKSSFFGLKQSYSMEQETYKVAEELDISINLASKFIPVVYGVNKIETIPVFADIELGELGAVEGSTTGTNEDSNLYNINVISEGPIRSIYDVIIEGEGLVCRDEADGLNRGTGVPAGNYSGTICVGVMDKGSVLGGDYKVARLAQWAEAFGQFYTGNVIEDPSTNPADITATIRTNGTAEISFAEAMGGTSPPATDLYSTSNVGITHNKTFKFDFRGDTDTIDITFHAGFLNQTADVQTGAVAENNGFKVQQLFYKPKAGGSKKDYWNKNHTLADTAYVLQKDKINASSGQQPKFDYVVKGKYVNCINYDGSYKAVVDQTLHSNYNLGDIVHVFVGDPTVSSNGTACQIIDKWVQYDPFAQVDYRFRLGATTGSTQSILDQINNGTAGKITMRPSASDTSVDWVMRAEWYTGNDSTPEITDATVNPTTGNNLFDVGGLVIDGTSVFSLNSVDFYYEQQEKSEIFVIDKYGAPLTRTVYKHAYGLDFHELYDDTFARNAIKVAAESEKSVHISFSVGNYTHKLTLSASMLVAHFNSSRNGKVVLYGPLGVSDSKNDQLRGRLEAAITAGTISTTKTQTSTSDLLGSNSLRFDTVTTYKYTNLPTAYVKNYSMIYQSSSDVFTTSEANGLTLNFSRDEGGDFETKAIVQQPEDSALATFCSTNDILPLSKEIITRNNESVLTNLKYSYGQRSSDVIQDEVEGESSQYQAVISAQDARVTNNPALILLDYLTNKRFGKGLTADLIDIPSFKEAALTCDTRSDVTVIVEEHNTQLASYSVGDICRYPANTAEPLIFQGEISKIELTVAKLKTHAGAINNISQITFTNCIGKLGKKWVKNEKYFLNDVVWSQRDPGSNRIILSTDNPGTEGIAIDEPSRLIPTQSTVILKNITANNSTFYIDRTRNRIWGTATAASQDYSNEKAFNAPSGNPLVKQIQSIRNSLQVVGGYSLYDSDEVKYWKYVGWETWEQRWVTRHQINPVIDTSQKLFDNVNTLLQQFNGILRYSNGKYYLDMRVKAKPISEFDANTEVITEHDIIGDIKIDDKGISKTFNAFSAQLTDPALVFENRTISFFNSDYLNQDKGIQRQGTFRAPAITNYFNARIQIEQALEESRAGLTISFKMPPKGYLLLAGNIIAITYPNFNWTNKLFRIESIKVQSDLLVDVVAREHDDNAYILSHMANDLVQAYDEGDTNSTPLPTRPINLIASQIVESEGAVGGIELNWENTGSYSPSTHSIEVWMNPTNGNFSGASNILTVSGTTTIDPILQEQGTTERWYWIRYKIVRGLNSQSTNLDSIFSNYYPDITEEGVRGFGTASLPERIHGIPKGATSNTAAKISTDSSSEFFSLSSAWTVDPEFGGTVPSGAYVMQRLTEPLGAKRYQFVWNGQRVGNYKWRGANDTHTLSDIKLLDAGEEYTIGSLQSSYSTTTTVANGTRNWDYYAIKSTRTDGIAQGSEEFIFDAYPAILASQGAPGNPANVTEANAVVDLSNVADNDTRELYVIFDHNVPKCFLAEWDVSTNNYGPDYWRDIGDGSATLDTAWTAISGTSFTRDSGYTITGVGTTFTSDFQEGDVVAYKDTELTSSSSVVGETSAFVVQIISDTQIRLDRLSPSASTINYLYRTAYRPDTTNDAVIAQIDRGS